MKNSIFILIGLVLFSCSTTKSNVQKAPLKIEKATYQNWYGGLEGVRGVKIEISGKEIVKDCNYETIYYLDKKAKLTINKNESTIKLLGNIDTSYRRNRMLSVNTLHEVNNKPPAKLKYPNLTKEEAIIEYIQNGKLKHFKVELVKKKDLLYQ